MNVIPFPQLLETLTCPLCNGTAVIEDADDYEREMDWFLCRDCGATHRRCDLEPDGDDAA